MQKKKTTITVTISVVGDKSEGDVNVIVELDGGSHAVMDLAEIAQSAGVLGETGMDYVLRRVLNEPGPPIFTGNDTLH